MITYLTGSITENRWGNQNIITNQYGFGEELKRHWVENAKCLYICSDKRDFQGNDGTLIYYRECFRNSGYSFSSFDLLDERYAHDFHFDKLASYDIIILGSGRVPQQASFFQELHLREFFQTAKSTKCFDGIVIGISAGSLNCAEETYNWPEEPGDSYQTQEEKFYQGLGLVSTQVLPHFQARYDMYVDGRHLYGDITIEDSFGHEFVAIPDYSYVIAKDGRETIIGPYSCYKNGVYYAEEGLRAA